MNNTGGIKGGIKFDRDETIDMGLDIISFTEDDTQIMYCPALDLSGYGKTVAEARASLKITIEEYFDYTAKKKTLREDLTRMGWQVQKSTKKKMTAPTMSKLLDSNDNFKRIFDTHSFRKTDTRVQIPAIA